VELDDYRGIVWCVARFGYSPQIQQIPQKEPPCTTQAQAQVADNLRI